MENFLVNNPTQLHFGKDVCYNLGEVVGLFGKKVLLVYGKGSIKKNGIYNLVIDQLKRINAQVTEFNGIRPNPEVADVDRASALGRSAGVDVVLAVGGGSVIDSSKITSLCIPEAYKAWHIMKGRVRPVAATPLVTVLTLAATGTEMNPYSVLQNPETKEKTGYGSPLIYPRHSFLDPSFTLSVPADYTAYGIVDLIAHCFEAYFGEGDASLSDRFTTAIVQEAMHYGPQLLQCLNNYTLRGKIMWAATNALNGLTSYGRKSGDWGVHSIGHTLSFLYDTPHGATLSIAYPAWLKLHKERIPERIIELGHYLFGINHLEETIKRIEHFFASLGSPVTLKEIGIGEAHKEEIISLMLKNKASGANHKLTEEDYMRLVGYML